MLEALFMSSRSFNQYLLVKFIDKGTESSENYEIGKKRRSSIPILTCM